MYYCHTNFWGVGSINYLMKDDCIALANPCLEQVYPRLCAIQARLCCSLAIFHSAGLMLDTQTSLSHFSSLLSSKQTAIQTSQALIAYHHHLRPDRPIVMPHQNPTPPFPRGPGILSPPSSEFPTCISNVF